MTNIQDVQNQVQKFWAPMFMKELREQLLLGALVNKDYQGEIKKQGDTVRVSQIDAPEGQLQNIEDGDNTFETEKMVTRYVDIKANRRAVGAFEFDDLVDLQSQLEAEDSEIRTALLFSCEKKINDYLYSLVAPSVSAPAHRITGVATMAASNLSSVRTLAAEARWLKQKGWYGLLSPQYYGNLLDAQTLTSKDYVEGESTVVSGQIVNKRYGFGLLEDDSRTGKQGLFFHPDFLHLVMQKEPTFKISDLHATKKFGFIISVDAIFGAQLGIDGDKKHITVGA